MPLRNPINCSSPDSLQALKGDDYLVLAFSGKRTQDNNLNLHWLLCSVKSFLRHIWNLNAVILYFSSFSVYPIVSIFRDFFGSFQNVKSSLISIHEHFQNYKLRNILVRSFHYSQREYMLKRISSYYRIIRFDFYSQMEQAIFLISKYVHYLVSFFVYSLFILITILITSSFTSWNRWLAPLHTGQGSPDCKTSCSSKRPIRCSHHH